MFKSRYLAGILCASMVLSSMAPAGVWADDFSDDFEVISDFEEEDFGSEEDFEEDTDELITDSESEDELLDETEASSETEFEEEEETEPDSESKSKAKKENLIEDESDTGELFEAEVVMHDIYAEMKDPHNNVYEMKLENVKGGTYRFQSYSDEDTHVQVIDLNNGDVRSDDDSGEGRNFKLVMKLTEGHDYRVRVQFLDWDIIDTLHFKIYREVPYAITYDANGGSGAPDVQGLPSKTGAVQLSSKKPTKYLTLTYDANGGKVDPATKKISLPFLSWHIDKAGQYNGYKAGGWFTYYESTTLYAKYEKSAAVGTLATPTRPGYDFDGWYTTKTGGAKVTASTTLGVDKTIYAHWKESGGIEGFIYRLYKNMLNREPDETGMTYWKNQLTSGKMNGAQVADGFIHSNEFKAKSMTDTAYLEIMYKTFLNRSSDAQGIKYWQDKLNNGMSRDYVFSGFVNSNEFKKICEQYGIKTGTVTLTEARDQNEGITTFIVRCYKKFLGRGADASGLNYWCNILLSGKMNAKEAAEGFVLSDEFKAKNTSNEEFIKTLYQGLLNRNADSTGIKYWSNKLSSGYDRSDIFQEFADSTEFRNLVKGFGLNSSWPNATGEKVYDGGKYTLTFPKEWKNRYVIKKNGSYTTIYEKTNYEHSGIGILFFISEVSVSKPVSFYSRYKYLGRSGSTDYYATFPTDVEFVTSNATLTANYRALNKDMDRVINSFKIKN